MWLNSTRMHVYTHLNDKWRYAVENITSEADLHGSGLMQHDNDVGRCWPSRRTASPRHHRLYTTDNGPEHSSWPHGATTPFRGEKMTTWEGGVRVVCMVRWPASIRPGQVLNGIQAHQDLFTTLAAAAGEPDAAGKMMRDKRQYIDGVNNLPYWLGQTRESARDHIFHYYESTLMALRMGPVEVALLDEGGLLCGRGPANGATCVQHPNGPVRELRQQGLVRASAAEDLLDAGAPGRARRNWHLKTLAEFPPVQGGKTFDMSNIVQEFIGKAKQ